jgi:hypothetical protein
VKLVLSEVPGPGLPGVKVSLYDRDTHDEDDLLVTSVTDAQGEIFFSFESIDYTDAEVSPSWRTDSMPDLYVVIFDAAGDAVHSTRSETLQDKLPKLLIIPIDRALAEKHNLLHLENSTT